MRHNLATNLATRQEKIVLKAIVLLLFFLFAVVAVVTAKQTQPDAKRVKQVQTALVEHGYEAGKTWSQTQEILRGIARDHGWQTRRAPDARVLILLDLGNLHSDPAVALEGSNYLDYKKTVDPEEDK